MAEYIEKAALLKKLDTGMGVIEMIRTFIDEEIPTVVSRWIPCSESLPTPEEPVLLCTRGYSVGEGEYHGHNGEHHIWKMYATCAQYHDYEITHWMFLPKPPKGKTIS